MFDVRIFHANAATYKHRELDAVYAQHETEKRKNYEQRVIQVEKCSFTPLVYSTTGGIAPRAQKFHQRLAKLIAEKKNEQYGDVIGVMRTKLSFCILKSVLISIRGDKGKRNTSNKEAPISCLSFNLVPESIEAGKFI